MIPTVRVDNPKKVYGNIGGISGQNEMQKPLDVLSLDEAYSLS